MNCKALLNESNIEVENFKFANKSVTIENK